MHLNKTSINLCLSYCLPDVFSIHNSLKHGDALLPLLFNLL